VASFLFFLFFFSRKSILKCDTVDESIRYALSRSLMKHVVTTLDHPQSLNPLDLIILSSMDTSYFKTYDISETDFMEIKLQGFRFKEDSDHHHRFLLYKDQAGLVYGLSYMDEHLHSGKTFVGMKDTVINPFLPYRIIKYNLPWSPYRNQEAVTLHDSTCRDLHYWEKFMDMMVDTRFNVLSLWNIHPSHL
jgi:hypothetical protein